MNAGEFCEVSSVALQFSHYCNTDGGFFSDRGKNKCLISFLCLGGDEGIIFSCSPSVHPSMCLSVGDIVVMISPVCINVFSPNFQCVVVFSANFCRRYILGQR